ncbi:hypothetical protein BDV32DRAFT_128585 [Aspergillus pseudonomiae]|nr:hypothetical protein BDV32DRAFT_128585 [Aspergillus pseudonomiae]
MLICTPDSKHSVATRQANAVRKLNHTRTKPLRPLAKMATVSITSDLEPYLASLRSYLARNRPASPGLEDRVDEQSKCSSKHHGTEHSRPHVERPQGAKNHENLGGSRVMTQDRS